MLSSPGESRSFFQMSGKWGLYLVVMKTEALHKRDNIMIIIYYQVGTEEQVSNKVRNLNPLTPLVANTAPQISHLLKTTSISFCCHLLPAK